MKRSLVSLSLAAVALSDAACGSDDSSTTTTSTKPLYTSTASKTSEKTTELTSEKATEKTTEETIEKTTAAETTEESAAADDATTAAAAPAAAGPAWAVDSGDGYCGTSPEGAELKPGANTSCAFAGLIYEAGIAQTYTTGMGGSGNMRTASTEFAVTSPDDGQSYTFTCTVGSDKLGLSCAVNGDNSIGAIAYMPDHSMEWPTVLTVS